MDNFNKFSGPRLSDMTPEQLEAYREAIRNLQAQDFYEPEMDNPQGIPLEDESQTMQADPTNIRRALQGSRREELMKKLFPESR